MPSRRRFLQATAAAAIASTSRFDSPPIKPPRLRAGDTIGIASPASARDRHEDLDKIIAAIFY